MEVDDSNGEGAQYMQRYKISERDDHSEVIGTGRSRPVLALRQGTEEPGMRCVCLGLYLEALSWRLMEGNTMENGILFDRSSKMLSGRPVQGVENYERYRWVRRQGTRLLCLVQLADLSFLLQSYHS